MAGQSFYSQINFLAITTPDEIASGKAALFAKSEGLYAKLPAENELLLLRLKGTTQQGLIAHFDTDKTVVANSSFWFSDVESVTLLSLLGSGDKDTEFRLTNLSTHSNQSNLIRSYRSRSGNTALNIGDDLLIVRAVGQYATNYGADVAEIKFYATEDFTTNNKGTAYSLKTFTAGSGGSFDTRHLVSGAGLTRINGGLIVGSVSSDPVSVLQSAGSFGAAITFTSGNLTLAAAHFSLVITGSHSITLPSASTATGRIYILANKHSSPITISSYKDMTGTGNTSIGARTSIIIQSDGTYWNQIF